MKVRKYVTIVEEIHSDGGRKMEPPGKRAAAVAVIKNPVAGEFAVAFRLLGRNPQGFKRHSDGHRGGAGRHPRQNGA